MDPGGDKPPAYGQQQPPPQGYGAQQPPPQGYGAQQPPPQGYGVQQPPPQGFAVQQQGYGAHQPPPQGTVVVMSSPQVGPGVRDWVNGLFGCFNNCNVCILSWFCPCYVVGQNAEALGESFIVYAIASFFIPLFVQWFVRMKIRGRLQITGSEIGDCCTVWCCMPCALAQERNEVLNGIQQGVITPNTLPQVIVRQ